MTISKVKVAKDAHVELMSVLKKRAGISKSLQKTSVGACVISLTGVAGHFAGFDGGIEVCSIALVMCILLFVVGLLSNVYFSSRIEKGYMNIMLAQDEVISGLRLVVHHLESKE